MISIVVCTHNRWASLTRTLASLASQVSPPGGLEIVVIDNGSTDETRERLASVTCGPHPVRAVREPRLGQSHARNRGIEAARGDWILFTDDDVLVDTQWAVRLTDGLQALGMSAGGGRVLPDWPERVPRWVARDGPLLERIAFVAFMPPGPARGLGGEDAPPVGCNMALHRRLVCDAETFSTRLGHQGKRLVGGEDTAFFARLSAAGIPFGYIPDAVVHHPVEPERLSLAYLLRRRFWEGYGTAQSGGFAGRRRWLGIPLTIPRELGRSLGHCALATLQGDWPAAAHGLGGVFNRLGCLRGLVRSS